MRLTMLLIFTAVIGARATGVAQTVSLSERNASLETVLYKIREQTGYRLWFEEKLLRQSQKVNIRVKKTSLQKALDLCFKDQPLTYEIIEQTIVVREAPLAANRILAQLAVARLEITGIVKDADGTALPGASVKVKGTAKGAGTDAEGRFSLSIEGNEAVLEVSFVGYETLDYPVSKSGEVIIVLKRQEIKADEFVVVGYGTQKKSDLTGAIGTVDVKRSFAGRPATNVQELMAGTVPGLNVSKGSGAVGSGATLNIRGTSTIGGSSGVLVLIDGMPGNIYTLNPNDIESISVLKDAASASIYGSRAANGVLLVTTKRGKSTGKPVLEVNTSVGVQRPQFLLDFVGSEDYMRLLDQALVNDGKQPRYGAQGIADLKAGKYANNLWYKDIYKKNTLINNNSLAVSGGSETVNYRLSGAYDYQDGTLPNNNYKRYVLKPDITVKFSPVIQGGASMQYTETYLLSPNGGTTQWQSQAARAAPVSAIYTPEGRFATGSSMVGNPVADVTEGGFQKERYKELMAIFDLSYTPVRNLTFKGQYSRYASDNWASNRVLSYSLYSDDEKVAAQKNLVTSLRETSSSNYRNMLQLTGDYSLTRGDHTFKLLGGYSQELYNQSSFSAFRDNIPFSAIHVLDVGSSLNMQNSGTAGDVAIQSYFGRLNYSFEDRYLFQANLRADGSSRFAEGHRWGVFPSFSAGWNVHNEAFFQADWISQLKLRASWGVLGDAEKVGYYATAAVLAYNPSMYGFNGAVVPGAWNNVAVNANISWEEAKQSNIGIDLGLLQQRITLTAEYFRNNREKILYAAPVPREFGLGAPLGNLLKLRNEGVELVAAYRDRQGDFSWGANLTGSYSKNTVTDLAGTGPWIDASSITDVGQPLGLPYGLEAIGLFQNESDVTRSPSQGPNVFPGNIKFKDQNGDKVIDGKDRVILNDKPVVRYGGSINVGWKNLDLSANFYGALRNYRYISGYEGWAFYLSQNARPMHLDSWTPENPGASYPRLTIQYTSNDTKYSSFWLRKANYLKLQNVQVGYTLPQHLLQKLRMSYVRLYLSGQNLATVTNYPGFDPEGGYYPISRTYSFGLNLKF